MAPASNDAGSALFAQKELAGELSATQSAECACRRADWGSFAQRGRRGMPAQTHVTLELTYRPRGFRESDSKANRSALESRCRAAVPAQPELHCPVDLPRVAAKAVGDSLCLAGRHDIATSRESQAENARCCAIGVQDRKYL